MKVFSYLQGSFIRAISYLFPPVAIFRSVASAHERQYVLNHTSGHIYYYGTCIQDILLPGLHAGLAYVGLRHPRLTHD